MATDREILGEKDTKKCKSAQELSYYNYQLRFFGIIPQEMNFHIVLIDKCGKGYHYLYKIEDEFAKVFIDISDLKGKYTLYVEMEEDIYNAMQYIKAQNYVYS